MRVTTLIILWLATASTQAASLSRTVDVSLTIHSEMYAFDYYYSKKLPKPSWNKDGSLSIWYLGSNTGSEAAIESGARAVVIDHQLSLCYATRAMEYAPDQPVPALVYPVVLEFRIRSLARGNYTIKEVSRCP